MICFVPAYDLSTQANLTIAKLIITSNCVTLFEKKATKQELILALCKADVPLFAMSHGVPDALKAQNGEVALSKNDVHLLGERQIYAFACHTAAELGKDAANKGSIWWGYSDTISCAIDLPALSSVFTDIFTFIRDNFETATSPEDRQTMLEELKKKCEAAQDEVDRIDSEIEIPEIMEVYRTLRHIWDRLRIWIPNAQQPEHHPQASSPSLPWGN